MKVFTLSQSQIDGDLYVLKTEKTPLTIMFGQITKTSSILKYLPRDFNDFGNSKP